MPRLTSVLPDSSLLRVPERTLMSHKSSKATVLETVKGQQPDKSDAPSRLSWLRKSSRRLTGIAMDRARGA
jgi:hypothetical protein